MPAAVDLHHRWHRSDVRLRCALLRHARSRWPCVLAGRARKAQGLGSRPVISIMTTDGLHRLQASGLDASTSGKP